MYSENESIVYVDGLATLGAICWKNIAADEWSNVEYESNTRSSTRCYNISSSTWRISSSRLSDAYMSQYSRPSLVQMIACRLFSANSLSKLTHWVHWWRPLQPTSSVITDAKSADLNLDDFARKNAWISLKICIMIVLNILSAAQKKLVLMFCR